MTMRAGHVAARARPVINLTGGRLPSPLPGALQVRVRLADPQGLDRPCFHRRASPARLQGPVAMPVRPICLRVCLRPYQLPCQIGTKGFGGALLLRSSSSFAHLMCSFSLSMRIWKLPLGPVRVVSRSSIHLVAASTSLIPFLMRVS